jgi:hypothetical protein
MRMRMRTGMRRGEVLKRGRGRSEMIARREKGGGKRKGKEREERIDTEYSLIYTSTRTLRRTLMHEYRQHSGTSSLLKSLA